MQLVNENDYKATYFCRSTDFVDSFLFFNVLYVIVVPYTCLMRKFCLYVLQMNEKSVHNNCYILQIFSMERIQSYC